MSWVVITLGVLSTTPAGLPVSAEVQQVLALLEQDPPIAEVQAAALEHFAVTEGDISGLRAAARLKALMPALTGSFVQDDGKLTRLWTDRVQWGGGAAFDPDNPQTTDATSTIGRAYTASATWNLGSLVFDANQLEAYSLVGIHEDVLKEVTRVYYTRQHNILALALEPPKEPRAMAALLLRTRELEAMLEALTGGGWSRLRQQRQQGR